MMRFFGRRLLQEKGDANIILLAAALPTLILVATAAVDIVRFPAVKQQIRSVVHAGVRNLTATLNGQSAAATGLGWCVLPHLSTAGNGCSSLPACAVDEDCDNCGCTGAADPSTAKHGLTNVGTFIVNSLKAGSVGFYSHGAEDISVDLALINLTVNPTTGEVKGREVVYTLVGGDIGADLALSPDLTAQIDKLIVGPGNLKLGIQMGTSASKRYFHVPVLVAVVGVRVHHVFNFTSELRFGEKANSKADSSVVVTTVVKPLRLAYAMHGESDSP